MNITFEFATQDDCLERMVPSQLRQLIAERDVLRAENERLKSDLEETQEALALSGVAYQDMKKERDRMAERFIKAIDDEPELEPDMPDILWEMLNDNKPAVMATMRAIVKVTKENIKERIAGEELK